MNFTNISTLKNYAAYIVTTSYFTGEGEVFQDDIMGRINLVSNNATIKLMSSAYYHGTRKSIARVYLIIPNSYEQEVILNIDSQYCDTVAYTGII